MFVKSLLYKLFVKHLFFISSCQIFAFWKCKVTLWRKWKCSTISILASSVFQMFVTNIFEILYK